MPITSEQISALRAAARRIVIIGKFNNTPGTHIFQEGSFSRGAFFGEVKPGLGRGVQEKMRGAVQVNTITLRPPLDETGELQTVPEDSPLFKGSSALWEAEGKKVLEKMLQAADLCMLYNAPVFGDDVLTLCREYVYLKVRAETGGEVAGQHWTALLKSQTEFRQIVLSYLLGPAADDVSALAGLEAWMNQHAGDTEVVRAIGKTNQAAITKAIVDLKACITAGSATDAIYRAVVSDQGGCPSFAEGKYTGRIPGVTGVRSFLEAYRKYRDNSDELHSLVRSPEQYSYIFWWFVTRYGEVPSAAVPREETLGIAECYKQTIDRAGRVQDISAGAKAAEAILVETAILLAGEKVEDPNLQNLAKRLLRDALAGFTREITPGRALSRNDLQLKITEIFSVISALRQPWFVNFRKASVEAGKALKGLAQVVANAKSYEDLQTKLNQRAEAATDKALKEQLKNFLASDDFKKLRDVADGDDFATGSWTLFYDVFGLTKITADFLAQFKMQSDQIATSKKEVERLFSLFVNGLGGQASGSRGGLPTFVKLGEEDVGQLGKMLETLRAAAPAAAAKLKLRSGASRPADSTKAPLEVAGKRVGEVEFVPPEQDGDQIKVSIDPAEVSEQLNLADLDLLGQPLAESVEENELKRLKDEVVRTARQSDLPNAIANEDLTKWNELLDAIHLQLKDAGADAKPFRAYYRAVTLGRYLLAAPVGTAPFEKADVSNVIGLLVDLAQDWGQLDETGKLPEPGIAEKAAINLSQYYPVRSRTDFALIVQDHQSILSKLTDPKVSDYIQELDAIADFIGAAGGSGLEIVVVNDTLGGNAVAGGGADCFILKHPARQAFLTSQNPKGDYTEFATVYSGTVQNATAHKTAQLPLFFSSNPSEGPVVHYDSFKDYTALFQNTDIRKEGAVDKPTNLSLLGLLYCAAFADFNYHPQEAEKSNQMNALRLGFLKQNSMISAVQTRFKAEFADVADIHRPLASNLRDGMFKRPAPEGDLQRLINVCCMNLMTLDANLGLQDGNATNSRKLWQAIRSNTDSLRAALAGLITDVKLMVNGTDDDPTRIAVVAFGAIITLRVTTPDNRSKDFVIPAALTTPGVHLSIT